MDEKKKKKPARLFGVQGPFTESRGQVVWVSWLHMDVSPRALSEWHRAHADRGNACKDMFGKWRQDPGKCYLLSGIGAGRRRPAIWEDRFFWWFCSSSVADTAYYFKHHLQHCLVYTLDLERPKEGDPSFPDSLKKHLLSSWNGLLSAFFWA